VQEWKTVQKGVQGLLSEVAAFKAWYCFGVVFDNETRMAEKKDVKNEMARISNAWLALVGTGKVLWDNNLALQIEGKGEG